MNTAIGTVVTVDEVCQAAATVLQDTLPGVLASIDDDRTIAAPSSYQQVPTREAVLAAEPQLPAVGIFSNGTATDPERDENGDYTKTWRITAVFYGRASSWTDTQWTVRTAAALIQAILVQSQTLGGIASAVVPSGETYDVLDWQTSRTLAGAAVDVDVTVQAAFSDTPTDLNNPESRVLTTGTEVLVDQPSEAFV